MPREQQYLEDNRRHTVGCEPTLTPVGSVLVAGVLSRQVFLRQEGAAVSTSPSNTITRWPTTRRGWAPIRRASLWIAARLDASGFSAATRTSASNLVGTRVSSTIASRSWWSCCPSSAQRNGRLPARLPGNGTCSTFGAMADVQRHYNFADLFELAADKVPDRVAVIDKRRAGHVPRARRAGEPLRARAARTRA